MKKWLQGFWRSLRGSVAHPTGTEPRSNQQSKPDAPVAPKSPIIRTAPTQISVGLDFGTHGTKVVYVQLGGARVFRPLDFGHSLADWPNFSLPAVGVVRNGGLIWGSEAARTLERRPWDAGIRRLKVLAASECDQKFRDPDLAMNYSRLLEAEGLDPAVWDPRHVMAAAVALQVVEVQRLLSQRYSGRSLKVQYALPVPIDQVDRSAVFAGYRRTVATAERLVNEQGGLTVTQEDLVAAAAEIFPDVPVDNEGTGRFNLFAEARAQMASYLFSLQTSHGIHGVIDIGAGTTDVSIFDLRKGANGNECFWYAAAAIPKATAFVVGEVLNREACSGLTEGEVLAQLRTRPEECAKAFEVIRHSSNPAWAEAYNHHAKSSYWEGCPVFVCGGGAQLPHTGRVFTTPYVPQWPNHKLLALPTPRDFETNVAPFERMAVAYGLAIPAPEHPNAPLPNDSPNHTPMPRVLDPYEKDGDQLVPNSKW